MTIDGTLLWRKLQNSSKESYSREELIKLLAPRVGSLKKAPLVDGDLTLDRNKCVVAIGGKEIRPPRRVYQVIEYLLEHRGWIVSRESLLQDIWQDHAHVEERTIDVHVAKARELVGKERIVTMPGMGYGWKE